MENIKGFISSEMKLPTSKSTKKKRYVTFTCSTCNRETTKIYQAKTFINACESCARGAFTTAEFIAIGHSKHGNKYDYSKTVYTGKRADVTITCPKHGDFTQRAQEHMHGHGCFQCGNELRGEAFKIPTDEWLSRLSKHPHISIKDVGEISDSKSIITYVCSKHGEFMKPLYAIDTLTYLCNGCLKEHHQPQTIRKDLENTDASIYYAYLPSIDMYKLGVSSDLQYRLNQLDANAVLLAEKSMSYTEAVEIETRLHNSLTVHRYFGTKKLIKNGNSELYKINIIDDVNRALQ